MKGLTKRQSEVLDYIQQFIQKNQYSPSYREIMRHFAFNSLGSVYKHVTILKRKGMLNAEKHTGRSLLPTQVIEQQVQNEVELIGQINANNSIEMFTKTQMITVPESTIHDPENTYALKIAGYSFADEMITDGDILLVEARSEANAGETVLGLVNQHDVVIKKYYSEGLYVRLVGHQSIILRSEDFLVHGIVVSLLRLYSL